MRSLAPLIAAFLCACSGDSETTHDTMEDMDGMTPIGDDDDDDTPAGCTAVAEGGWSASGSCFGHDMTATLTLGADGCSFTLSSWNMPMSTPDGGTVEGSEVMLDGADWTECTGTTDGSSISGTCSDGCDFDMISDG
jgi:hypothetical protein